jgi:hypothetical protein
MRATTKRLSEVPTGGHGSIDGRSFTVRHRWPEDRGPGYTEVSFADGEVKTFCWDYENPNVQVSESQ